MGCRSGTGGGQTAPAGAAQPGPTDPAPGGDGRPQGQGWVWTAPPPAWVGLSAADDREIAFTYEHQHLVLLDAGGRRRWQSDRLRLRDVAPTLALDMVVAATDDGLAGYRRSDGTELGTPPSAAGSTRRWSSAGWR